MLNKVKNRKQEGFTIIEVLIVLAIAGLILLIVFLAVPNLQRNSRNTQLRNSIASLVGVVNEYSSNNNGALPSDVCALATTAGTVNAGDVYVNSAGGCGTGTNTALAGKTQVGITVTTGSCVSGGGAAACARSASANSAANSTNNAVFVANAKCSTGGAITYNARSFAFLYSAETAGSTSPQCVES